MLRFQISAQKTFPKVMLSAAGTGHLESSGACPWEAEGRCTVAWMCWGEWEQVQLVPAELMLLQRLHVPFSSHNTALCFCLLPNMRSPALPALHQVETDGIL